MKRHPRLVLLWLIGLMVVGTSYQTARAQEVVRIGDALGKFEEGEPTGDACEEFAVGAPTAASCTCCVAHRYALGDAPGSIEGTCSAPIDDAQLCSAPVLTEIDGTAAGRAGRIALSAYVARRLPMGNPIADGQAFPGDVDLGQVMDLLDAAYAAALPFPAPGTHADPFAGGNLDRACVRIVEGTPGQFTLGIYLIFYSDTCATAQAQPGQEFTDYSLRYVAKVLRNPLGELYNLEDLRGLLVANNYWGGVWPLKPNITNGSLPDIVIPYFSLSYMAGTTRRFLTLMPAAPGAPLARFAERMEAGQVTAAPANGASWVLAPIPKGSIGDTYKAWAAAGEALGSFHLRFMATRAPGSGAPILRSTVIHGDFHQDNVFVDVSVTPPRVTFIDAESMAASLRAYVEPDPSTHKLANEGVAPGWLDFIRPFAFSCCLDNIAVWTAHPPPLFPTSLTRRMTKGQLAELTIRPFLKGYAAKLVGTSLATDPAHADWAAVKAELWNAFNRNATALSWRTLQTSVPGAKGALYSPWRYHQWKKAIRRLLTAAPNALTPTAGGI